MAAARKYSSESMEPAAGAVEPSRPAARSIDPPAVGAAARAAILQDVSGGLAAAGSTEDVVRVVFDRAVVALGAEAAAISLVDESRTTLAVSGVAGFVDADRIRTLTFPITTPVPHAEVVLTGEPRYFSDNASLIAHFPHLIGRPAGAFASYAVLPLVTTDAPIGAVGFSFATPRAFDDDDRALLLALAQQAAVALERARLVDALRASEQRFRSLIERSHEAICLLGADGVVRYASPSTERVLGYTPAEFVGLRAVDITHPDDIVALAGTADHLAAAGAVVTVESRIRHKDGSWRWVESTITNLIDDPAVEAFVSNYRDVTDRRIADAERARLLVEERSARSAAERSADRALRLQGLTAALNSAATPDAVGQVIVDHGMAAYGATTGSLAFIDAARTTFTTVHARGYSGTTMARYATYPLVPGRPVSDAVHTRSAIFVEDVSATADPSVRAGMEEAGVQAFVAVPIRLGEAVTSVVGFGFREARIFDPEDRIFFAIVGDLTSQALERARAYADELDTRQLMAQSEARYRGLFAGVADAVLVLNEDGRYIDANPAAEALFGYHRDEILTMGLGSLFAGGIAVADWPATKVRLRVESVRGESEARHRDGRLLTVEWFLSAAVLPGGTVYIRTIRDLTDRRAAELRARQLVEVEAARRNAEQAVAERDRFLSVAAHELRTPVAGIRGYTDLLGRAARRGQPDSATLLRYVDALIEGTNRLTTLTNDLLDVARLQQGVIALRRAPIDLGAIVGRVVDRFRDLIPAGQRIEASIAPVVIDADADRIDQVITNLLENASKYSPADGHITVIVTDAARITVRDNGIGLPAGAEATIFEPFHRTANADRSGIPGLGLGLYICRQIIDAHGGRIWAESPGEGQGTTITVDLPDADDSLGMP